MLVCVISFVSETPHLAKLYACLYHEPANLQVQYLSFDNQISSFEQIKNAMIAKIGKKAAEETINGAIFQIGLGKNIHSNLFSSFDANKPQSINQLD